MSDQIELVHLRAELETVEACAASKQRSIDDTLRMFGDGVRPSWVSADLAIDGQMRDQYLRIADDVRAKIAEIEKRLTNTS